MDKLAMRKSIAATQLRTEAALGMDPAKSEYDLLVCLISNVESALLAFGVLQPKRLLLLYTNDTEAKANEIHSFACPEYLKATAIDMIRCDSVDPADIYKKARSAFDTDGVCKPILDITGGKKVMSVAAAFAAWQRNVQACYIESDYSPTGSIAADTQRLIVLKNPLDLFGGRELDEAHSTFGNGRFDLSASQFAKLAELTQPPPEAAFMRDLATAYHAWTEFDLATLTEKPLSLPAKLHNHLSSPDIVRLINADIRNKLQRQFALLDRLGNNDIAATLISFHVLGAYYKRHGRKDFAALFFYRCLEGCFYERLRAGYGLTQANPPQYERFGIANLQEQMQKLSCAITQRDVKDYRLPHALGFMPCLIILHILGDDLLRIGDGADAALMSVADLTELYHASQARNNSILAHGMCKISDDSIAKIEFWSEKIIKRYMALTADSAGRIDKLQIISEPMRRPQT